MKHKTRQSKVRSMRDIAGNDFPDPTQPRIIGPGKGIIKPNMDSKKSDVDLSILEGDTNYEYLEKEVKKYNKDLLKTITKKYKEFKPFRGLVVRCFHRESTQTEGGIYIPMQGLVVDEITQNGLGVRDTLPSPWQYSREAVIVAWSDEYGKDMFKFGQKVLLNVGAIQAGKQSVDSPFVLPFGFTISEHPNNQPPKKLDDEDYGYLKIDPYKFLDGFVS